MSDKIKIDHVAQLARLKLTEEEKARFSEQLNQIVDYIDQLNELDTSSTEPTSHVLPLNNVFREDELKRIVPVDSNEELLKLAPEHDKGHYKVPQIIS